MQEQQAQARFEAFNSPRVLLQLKRLDSRGMRSSTFNSPRVLLQHSCRRCSTCRSSPFNSPRVLLQHLPGQKRLRGAKNLSILLESYYNGLHAETPHFALTLSILLESYYNGLLGLYSRSL